MPWLCITIKAAIMNNKKLVHSLLTFIFCASTSYILIISHKIRVNLQLSSSASNQALVADIIPNDAPKVESNAIFETTKTKKLKRLKRAGYTPKEAPLSPWVQQYIAFHQESIVDGKLKDDVRYIVYECLDGENRCGGAGDRLIGMIKCFYFAMVTNRVLLIDAQFPTPLTDVFIPQIEWNATFPKTTVSFSDLDYNIGYDMRLQIIGYSIPRTNGVPRKKSLADIWSSRQMVNYLKRGEWYEEASKIPLATVAREAFRAMFQVTEAVKDSSLKLKRSAGMLDAYDISAPYVGMHIRTGDSSMGIGNAVQHNFRGTGNASQYLGCFKALKQTHSILEAAYLASDDVSTKEKMKQKDPSIYPSKDIQPFHIDLAVRKGTRSKYHNLTAKAIYTGVIESWAEMLALAQSTCLIISNSMYVVGASLMRDPKTCSVAIEDCDDINNQKGGKQYFGENIWEVNFTIVPDQTLETLVNNIS